MLERLEKLAAEQEKAPPRRRRGEDRPPSRARPDAAPGADRDAARSRFAVPRAGAARRLRLRVRAGRLAGRRDRPGRGRRVHGHRLRSRPCAAAPRTPTRCARACGCRRSLRVNRLPAIGFVESGGADLPRQKEIFVPGGATFRNLTQASAAGVPTVALVTGNSTAGGAYLPGMSDYVVMVREQGLVFLGGSAAGQDGDRRGGRGGGARRRRDALADLRRLRVHGRRRGRSLPDRARDRPQPELAQARARLPAAAASRPCTTPRSCSGSPPTT